MGSWGRVKLQREDSRKIPSKQSHRFPVGEVEAEPAGAQLAGAGGRETGQEGAPAPAQTLVAGGPGGSTGHH